MQSCYLQKKSFTTHLAYDAEFLTSAACGLMMVLVVLMRRNGHDMRWHVKLRVRSVFANTFGTKA